MNAAARIDFASPRADIPPLRRAFAAPRALLRAYALADVRPVLAAAEQHAREGRWAVGFVRYEAAQAFDAALATHAHDGMALAQFAIYDAAGDWPMEQPTEHPLTAHANAGYAALHWQHSLTRADFDANIARIHRWIADGELYQLNLTTRLSSAFHGDAWALFNALHRAQPDGYAAFIDTGDEQLLSVSPELFFDWRDGRLLLRPMKGTAARGATAEEDNGQAERLRNSIKERAENLMIVDLLRNDVSRIAQPFSVKVPRLFHTQAWPTVWQMTSDIEACTRPGVGLADVFRALFPSGSVTGAPKVRATQLIRQIEPDPRAAYCGAIGVIQPGGAATFNVAIRTVEIRDGVARCGIGSGITLDASSDGEWAEWRHKQAFVERASQPFELLETLRLEAGAYAAADEHLARMARAARHFGFAWNATAALDALRAQSDAHPHGLYRVRLCVDAQGRAHAQSFALAPPTLPLRVALAATPFDAADSEFVRFKTTRRSHYEAAASSHTDCFDTLLWNARGELTEFTRGNVAVLLDGHWLTPPLRCGLLDGIGRAHGLQEGRIREAVVCIDDLPRAQGLAFFNALRGWLPANLVST